MDLCPQCGKDVAAGASMCPACGAILGDDSLRLLSSQAEPRPARMSAGAVAAPRPAREARGEGGEDAEERYRREKFVPGAILAGRYRLVQRLGRGGMGEVYRAEDLVLGADVALKFLARHLTADAPSRERLASEVRIARTVTHPNVCRVHDLGEVDGRPFISMEYVDGEDLGSLLRRIGRLPPAKATELARQIAAGLSAAHGAGVLHRDLKPANVMIDGRGQARLTDFGLAVAARAVKTGQAFAGTPAYMSPEQVHDEAHTARSDIFAMGLVIYEMFSGEPVFRPTSLEELMRLHDEPRVHLSTLVPEIDPAVESVVMQCLESNPAKRPESAQDVVSALSGADPLQRAVAAGETPDPSLVAASGAEGRVAPWLACAILLALFAGVALTGYLHSIGGLLPRVPLTKSLDVLDDRTTDLLARLGYRTKGVYSRSAFDLYEELLWTMANEDSSPNRWDRLSRVRPAPIDYWYRQSLRPIVGLNAGGVATYWDPPEVESGMLAVRLDPAGRLRELWVVTEPASIGEAPGAGVWLAVPSEMTVAAPDGARTPDWRGVFAMAGLDIARFEEAPPERVPPFYVEQRRAWTGVYPDYTDEPIRVEAASMGDHVVAFRIVEEKWRQASSVIYPAHRLSDRLGTTLWTSVRLGALGVGLYLAWRNLRLRRGDRAGAMRVSVLCAVLLLVASLLQRDHPGTPATELAVLLTVALNAITHGLLLWVGYVAVEPEVRRLWPETLISWSRVLAGRTTDPLVGLSVLVGAGLGILGVGMTYVDNMLPGWLRLPPPPPVFDVATNIDALSSPLQAIGTVLAAVVTWTELAILGVLGTVISRAASAPRPICAVVFGLALTGALVATVGNSWASWLVYGALVSVGMLVAVRYGLLALIAGGFVYEVLLGFPVPTRTDVWYTPVCAGVIAALAVILACAAAVAAGVMVRRPDRVGGLSRSLSMP